MKKRRKKARPTIRVFAGIFDFKGRLLLRKRESNEAFPGMWELTGGAICFDRAIKAKDERLIGDVLSQRVEAETGLLISNKIQPMPAMYPTILKGGSDIAFAIIVGEINQKPTKGKTRFVSVKQLLKLADTGKLLSGRKRMFRLCLRMFVSRDCPNARYRQEASDVLKTLHT
jgi:hypothetical protein